MTSFLVRKAKTQFNVNSSTYANWNNFWRFQEVYGRITLRTLLKFEILSLKNNRVRKGSPKTRNPNSEFFPIKIEFEIVHLQYNLEKFD